VWYLTMPVLIGCLRDGAVERQTVNCPRRNWALRWSEVLGKCEVVEQCLTSVPMPSSLFRAVRRDPTLGSRKSVLEAALWASWSLPVRLGRTAESRTLCKVFGRVRRLLRLCRKRAALAQEA